MRLKSMLSIGIAVVVWTFTGSVRANAQPQGLVRLYNASHPSTSIEVGNTILVLISSSYPDSPVTFTQNGGGPYPVGNTDGNGNFSLYNTMTSDMVASYNQHWFVDGVEVILNNPDPYYAPDAPRLPDFTVRANFSGNNCAGGSITRSACGTGTYPYHWVYSPVTYNSTSSIINSATADAVAQDWNSIQSKIWFSNDTSHRIDVRIYDTNLSSGILAQTATYGYDCYPPCYGYFSIDCSAGACLTSGAVWRAEIQLSTTEIFNTASALGIDPAVMAKLTLEHEMGHTLRLGDVPWPNYGICSQIQTMMWQQGSDWSGCGITRPNSVGSCDANSINGVYPSPAGGGLGSCATGAYHYCSTTRCA